MIGLKPRRRRARMAGRAGHAVIALGLSGLLMWVLAAGAGPVPALGPVLDPGHGVWDSAPGAQPPAPQTLAVPGLSRPARVWFTGHGVPAIHAASARDAFLALGYLHARFRLAQMDLQRRLGEGRLAQLAGPAAVSSDEFELRLGLLRTARQEWAQTPRSSPAGQALLAYARGVNDYLAQARGTGQWPALFSLTGTYPADWTPVDSLAVQGVLTQQLDFTTTPLDYALLERTLGPARTMAWFPVQAPGAQFPYDPGPYRKLPLAPLPATSSQTTAATAGRAAAGAAGVASPGPATTAGASGPTESTGAAPGQPAGPPPARPTLQAARAAASLLAQVSALPPGQVHRYPDSNAWAANGPAVAGRSMLAGDPHLPQTLPSVWYQAALSAPGLAVTGVTVAGLPGVLLGHNAHIAWSLTDTQNQATFFYTERTSRARPGQYFWRGAWRRMRQLLYTIAVHGAPPVRLTVDLTVHGPVMTRQGQTTSVDWMGDQPSADLAAMLGVGRAASFAQFRAALAAWHAPTQNFVYADDRGNIGAISAGYYPVVAHGDPWLPLPGTGASDVAGTIPQEAVPQVYDPPGHLVITANQRPVSAAYPYYIGTSADFFDPGYRAQQIGSLLSGRARMTASAFAAAQTSVTDPLAAQIVPRLLAALRGQRLTARQQAAAALLRGWRGGMTASSAAASVWWTFWSRYLSAVFQPWWHAARVPVRQDPAGLRVSPGLFSLDEDLQAWTLSGPGNPAFTPPGGPRRTAPQVMRAAFTAAVARLAATLPGPPSSWRWGRLHRREFQSITGAGALGYGPRPAGGGPWTVDAADGGLVSHTGPSWRMIVAWSGPSAAAGQGVYPGGQNENPASSWYADQVAAWWAGRHLPMPPAGGYPAGKIRWELAP
ncbi:MAG: penicillin acylase family protein [Gemmatimonadota bacterium]